MPILDAEEALRRGTYTVGEQEWVMLRSTQPGADDEDSCTLEVKGFKADTSHEYMSLFFESPKNQGGKIVDLEYIPGSDVALVTFAEQDG